MSDPHNPARIGETWDAYRLGVMLREVHAFRDFGVLSGGWAWHFMSPPHLEEKHLHDHKDVDLFVVPQLFSSMIPVLTERGYEHVTTRFDGINKDFIRYTRYVIGACPRCIEGEIVSVDGPQECLACGATWAQNDASWSVVKVMFDLFIQEVDHIEIDGIRVVEPARLLSFYGAHNGPKHTSQECVAVKAARALLAKGQPVPKDPSLIGEWALR